MDVGILPSPIDDGRGQRAMVQEPRHIQVRGPS